MKVRIIGAGLAGSEAAYYLANRGIKVELYEMRDKAQTPAHQTPYFAELICSNSFKSTSIENAHGLLKKELELLDSFILKCAFDTQVPAGGALAVDRLKFSKLVTEKLKEHPGISFINEESISFQKLIDDDILTIIATGPLTSDRLAASIFEKIGVDFLYFYDAQAPIVNAETINYDKVFFQSRYDKGGSDYLNAPMNKEEYYAFVNEIKNAEKVEFNSIENIKTFEGCLPVETLAGRGEDTLAFGPLKPVGLNDPKTGKCPYAVVQLRTENISKTMFNLVGFQTRLKWKEQERVFRMIPGLKNAEFLRYGVMHKNTYLYYPGIIDKRDYSLTAHKNIYFAGQITGVEGYMESAASGLYTAYSLSAKLNYKDIFLPENTMIGSLQKYTVTENKNYQPMPSNFGLLGGIDVKNEKGKKAKGKDKKKILAAESISALEDFIQKNFI